MLLLLWQIAVFVSWYTWDIFFPQYKPCDTQPCTFHTEIFNKQNVGEKCLKVLISGAPQPHTQALMRYRVTEGGLEPSAIGEFSRWALRVTSHLRFRRGRLGTRLGAPDNSPNWSLRRYHGYKGSYLRSGFNFKRINYLGIIANFTEESFLATELFEKYRRIRRLLKITSKEKPDNVILV